MWVLTGSWLQQAGGIMWAEVWWSHILNVCLLIKPILAPDWSATVTSGFIIGHWWLALTEPHICILASLFPSCPDGMQAGSLSANEKVEWSPVSQSEARWHYWWVRGWPVQWSHLWSPSSGAGLQTWGRHGYNECGMSHSHWYGQSWLLQTSPDKYSLLLSPRHSLHFSFSPRLFRLTLYEPLEIYGLFWCLDVWPVRWGNENGLCDIQSDKNMDFWKMKYETAHYATG